MQRILSIELQSVPNPYISANAWEKRNLIQTDAVKEEWISFIFQQSTIRITLLPGFNKDTSKESGRRRNISWNLITEDGMDLAFDSIFIMLMHRYRRVTWQICGNQIAVERDMKRRIINLVF